MKKYNNVFNHKAISMKNNHQSERRTEDVVLDLLDIQGWNCSKPPQGRLIRQNEYKAYSHLAEIFKGKSKSGSGDAYPDFLLVSENLIPQVVIEAKADVNNVSSAIKEAEEYANACLDCGHITLAVGVAGQEESGISVIVRKRTPSGWKTIKYGDNPITWIPTQKDLSILISSLATIDLAPIVPRPEVLAKKADLINRILREAHVKDEYRPAYVGATILALWKSGGNIRRNPKYILGDINTSCKEAFVDAGKPELAVSLKVDEANSQLASTVWQIIAELEKLNILVTSFDHDYLGQLYETFFRYTGGNTIGQYFTPRHLARFMADVCQTNTETIVIDPACGTGGFLIAALQRAAELSKLSYEKSVEMVKNNLFGYESEPITAALCVANMILRGDGKTGVKKDDCFTAKDYPIGKCQVALLNPPFPHKASDDPPQKFVERALEALDTRGILGIIVPTSFVVKKEFKSWRQKILNKNSLLAVCQLPDELFQPYASSTTSVIFLEKGIKHDPRRHSVFVRLEFDGLTLKKGTRVPRTDGLNQIPDAIDSILNKKTIPGFSGTASVVPGDE